jgi:hypothetical protein
MQLELLDLHFDFIYFINSGAILIVSVIVPKMTQLNLQAKRAGANRHVLNADEGGRQSHSNACISAASTYIYSYAKPLILHIE